MSAMNNVNTSPPASQATKMKKDFVIEVESDENKKDLEKSFDEQLNKLTE